MLKRFIIAAILGIALCGYCSAQTILIDNFTLGSPPSGSTITLSQTGVGSTATIFTGLAASTVINPTGGTNQGNRIARAHVVSGNNVLNVDNVGNELNVGLGSATSGHFHLYYGYNDFDPTLTALTQPGANYADLSRNFSVGTNNAITLNVLNPDHNGGVEIALISGRGTGSQAIFVVSQPYITGNPSNQLLVFPLSAFTGINLTDIDQIIVEPLGNIPDAGDLELDNIQVTFAAVPEPATMAFIGLSGVIAAGAVWNRRRKKTAELEAICS